MDANNLLNILYFIFFIFFVFKIAKLSNSYLFSGNTSWFTYFFVFFFTLFFPIVYTSFTLGSIVLILRSSAGNIPVEWAFPILYIIVGYIFMRLPFKNYYKERKLAHYTLGIATFWLLLGLLLIVTNPAWNNQLEKNLNTAFPSIGQFFVFSNLLVLIINGIFYKFFYAQTEHDNSKVEEHYAKIK